MPANRHRPQGATLQRLDFGTAGNWNAIEARAREFVDRWRDSDGYEKGESQHFWSEFLAVFGVDYKRAGAFFEYRTRKLSGAPGFVDLFWPGRLIAEQKSAGRDLNVAMQQALDYLPAMPDHELPRAVVVSDFKTFDIARLDGQGVSRSFPLEELPDRVKLFDFLFDLDTSRLDEQNPVNVKAAQDVAKLHEALKKKGYRGEDLEVFLTRVVFCLFAEDTGIFNPGQFSQYVRYQSRTDGTNLGRVLNELFEILDTPETDRMQGLAPELAAFPYVNGGLFEGTIRTPALDTETRSAILTASLQNWSEVNPSIFGSMFQGVMDEVERRNLGAHYTSEKNILRLIQPLFLDDLYQELDAAIGSPTRLDRLHDKIANLKFLDPACGSGNFLVITYRELRRLEHKLLQEKLKGQQFGLGMAHLIRTSPDQMAGIEIEEFPAKVAELALWLTDHQMNIEAAKMFGGSIDEYARIPIESQPNIVHANALRIDWGDVVELSDLDYIIGNPPFIGHQWRNAEQVEDMNAIWGTTGSFNRLDYVTCWFRKASDFVAAKPEVGIALVATNSIAQGEQVRPLWETLFNDGNVINFAHRTFQWRNEAQGIAAVHCVIVGFSRTSSRNKRIYVYDNIQGDPIETQASNINGYLVDAPNVFIASRSRAPKGMPELSKGSQPTDGGHLILTQAERDELLEKEPGAAPYIRRYMGSSEFINDRYRYCLWLKDISPSVLRSLPHVRSRVERVAEVRLKSPTKSVREYSQLPTLFTQDRQPESDYLAIPEVSSERREYIPIGYISKDVVASSKLMLVRSPSLYLFGLLTSSMHMAWMRSVGGRLKSDYSYSPSIYNNFPWPEKVSESQRERIEELAQAVLDARDAHPTSTLADLYDPLAMPPNLRKAHNELDRAVDRLYRSKPFEDDADRVALLLRRYQALTAGKE